MKKTQNTLLALVLIVLSSCNTTKSDNFDWGYVIEGNYENKFFGIDWPIPADWTYDDTFAQRWTKVNRPEMERLAEGVYDMKQRIKMPPNSIKDAMIFQLNKFKLGTESNPTILVYSENLAAIEEADVQNMDDYMALTVKEAAKTAGMTLDSDDYETDRIGGAKFYKLTGKVKEGDKTSLQRYYATEINGFGLTFILTAFNKAGLEELEEVFRTISL